MVMVGQSKRLAEPVSGRQRRVVAALGGLLLAALAALILITALGPGERPDRGCVDVVVAGSLGGNQLHQCGQSARQWCASERTHPDVLARRVLEQCRRSAIRPL